MPGEGVSRLVGCDGELIPLTEAVQELGAELIGERIWKQYGGFPVYSKFFDNLGPLPHHIHHRAEHAALVGERGKPECYYFPPQMNNHGGHFPFTFFGFEPGTTREQVRRALMDFNTGDNGITHLSRAYRLQAGTGWDVPPGLLHAPGSLCTYEPQAASDVYAMYQSLADDRLIPESLLWKDCPADRIGDSDYLLKLIDWELNVDPELGVHRFMLPVEVRPEGEMTAGGYSEKWICYKSAAVSARELTILPGREAVIEDAGAYGLIAVQGYGELDGMPLETATLIRYGQLTFDEYFVSESAAGRGVRIVNRSAVEPLVMLKHFGPGNPECPVNN